jgi:hypothetical protein
MSCTVPAQRSPAGAGAPTRASYGLACVHLRPYEVITVKDTANQADLAGLVTGWTDLAMMIDEHSRKGSRLVRE